MIIIASANGKVGIKQAMEVLKSGGSALDAVEAGIKPVEANPNDHTVGYGGYPNLLGQVELDACIMDGQTLQTGAVGAIQGYMHPISIARKVMENLPHVFLVGAGANRFAAEMGFKPQNLLTPEAQTVWETRLRNDMDEASFKALAEQNNLWERVKIATDPERAGGTVNFIAQDKAGNIAGGVSTSGWAWKYPGRLGDSPVIGAGLYADNRYGAAACTGMGEMAIRAATARSIVLYMKLGYSLAEAGQAAMADLNDLGGNFLSRMNFIILKPDGTHAGFSNARNTSYTYMNDDMDEPEILPRTYIPTQNRWQL